VPLIEELIEERRLARDRGDYKLADDIREWLRKAGVYLRDKRDGTKIAPYPPRNKKLR